MIFDGFTTVSCLYMPLEIEIIPSNTCTDSKHFLFIIFIDLRISAGRVSHDVHFSMRRFLKVHTRIKRFSIEEKQSMLLDGPKCKHV